MNRHARRLLIAAALLAMALLYFGSFSGKKPASSAKAPPPSPSATAQRSLTPASHDSPPASSAAPRRITSAPSDPQAGTGAQQPEDAAATGPRYYASIATAPQRQAAERDAALQTVAQSLRDYRAALGQVPIGSNPEITRALTGENNRNAHFLRADLPINASGELVDQWGSPYFFHQLSRTQIDVYSAGPDRAMWTDDDEIVH